MAGVNMLIGPADLDASAPVDDTVVITNDNQVFQVAEGVRDGSEYAVAAWIAGALVFLILLRAGGFQTVIAASITTGR